MTGFGYAEETGNGVFFFFFVRLARDLKVLLTLQQCLVLF